MKSNFAKIVDHTLGAALLFFAVTAIMAAFVPIGVAAGAAVSVTAAAFIILDFKERKAEGKVKLSEAADTMFFDFMFEDERLPAKLAAAALVARGENAAATRSAVYLGKTAAFFRFSAPPDDGRIARDIAIAKRHGATNIVEFCHAAPAYSLPEVSGFTVKIVDGENTYKLMASLGALPPKRFAAAKKKRFAAFKGALGKDKIVKYALLSAGLFVIASLTRFSVVTVVCASISAVLFAASLIGNIVSSLKKP